MVLAIDLSLDSTGICFSSGMSQIYVSFGNSKKIDEHRLNRLNELKNFRSYQYERESVEMPKKVGYLNWQRQHITSCISMSNSFKAMLHEFDLFMDDSNLKVVLEAYSYSANSTYTHQIIEYTSMIKKIILNDFGVKPENFYIVPGPTIKKFAGAGDLDKFGMLQKFMELESDGLVEILKSEPDLFLKQRVKAGKPFTEVLSPVSDIIDAYFLAKYVETKHSQLI